ncbi:Ppx/GppA phosphatase family protein [Piscinibacter sp. XHJ-5]|uniref:Ppx/GppA phosphatase family protein n=1 Tax=Piscinibacter sp. XHJ-5 TaxID=3037797 RepID=UPI002452A995|nr:Ppx/GppA phosphatase family protein [Piscinibacter sp. XHJ-5]
MGSNSFRLEIGQLHQGRYRRIDYLKETVRLGGGLDDKGLLTEEAIARGLECLSRFAKRLQGFLPSQVRAVATQTLREARNRDAFLARARPVLGQPIEVISGREEARLIYAGVARLQPSERPRLVVDIGGRSTEMILGRSRIPKRAESFQVGSVSLSMKYFGDGRFTEAAFRAAQVAAGAELEEALEPFASSHWSEALGSSGTVGAVSQLLSASHVTDGRITPPGLRWLMEQCLQAGRVERLSLPGLKDDRRAVIAGGLAILYTLAMHFGIQELWPARGALRQGVIFDLDERLEAAHHADGHDIRDASVHELQRRFIVDVEHAERVRTVAESLHERVRPRADREARRELQWACALHEVGMMVSHHDHHRHSAYVLGHVDAPGFSQSQQRRLAELVLAQRGGLRKVEASLVQEEFAWQVMCLRIAIIACHARGQVDPQALALRRSGSVAALSVPGQWADTHPRTLHLLNEEVAAWERGGPLQLELRA